VVGFLEAFLNGSKELCIVMEYCSGGDLEGKIKGHRKMNRFMPELEIWTIFSGLANGVKYLHEKNVVHRDIKSANCFLDAEGRVKIGDLNISKLMKEGEMLRTQIGTPYYMPPEVWKNRPYNEKSDLWCVPWCLNVHTRMLCWLGRTPTHAPPLAGPSAWSCTSWPRCEFPSRAATRPSSSAACWPPCTPR
jgi:NIMA (never in mitosis gene a)-related kinase